jgi:hypothetical protein
MRQPGRREKKAGHATETVSKKGDGQCQNRRIWPEDRRLGAITAEKAAQN